MSVLQRKTHGLTSRKVPPRKLGTILVLLEENLLPHTRHNPFPDVAGNPSRSEEEQRNLHFALTRGRKRASMSQPFAKPRFPQKSPIIVAVEGSISYTWKKHEEYGEKGADMPVEEPK